MKDILVVVTPQAEKHFSVCNTIAKEVEERRIPLRRPLENTFLLSGPKSFEGAIACRDICDANRIPYAVFEVESVLHSPFEREPATPGDRFRPRAEMLGA